MLCIFAYFRNKVIKLTRFSLVELIKNKSTFIMN